MESQNNKTEWGITVEQEREIWSKEILNILIPLPKHCNCCNKGLINLRKNNSINNPYLGKCNNYKCNREVYLRVGTIFEYNNKTPVSILYNVIIYWLHDDLNANKIVSKLKETYNLTTFNKVIIYKFISRLRIIIANYIRSIYVLEPLAHYNAHNEIACDESLFTHCGGNATWVVGLLNLVINEIRLEIVESRDSPTLKTIIEKHIMGGNIIYTDCWSGYNFLSNINSNYTHISFNYANGHFGKTSRIEGIWGEIKQKFKKLYNSIRSTNFIYFLREMEFRRSIKLLSKEDKIKNLASAISVVGIDAKENLLGENDLLDLNYETMYDDDY